MTVRWAVINDCAYRTLGLTPDPRHLGQHFADVLGSAHRFSEVFETAFELAHLPNRCELRLDETGQVLGYTLSRIVDAEDRVTGAVLYFKDLTRVEQLEERERLRDRLAALGENGRGNRSRGQESLGRYSGHGRPAEAPVVDVGR